MDTKKFRLTEGEDGSVTIEGPRGTMALSPDGKELVAEHVKGVQAKFDLSDPNQLGMVVKEIKKIAIENILDVVSYDLTDDGAKTTHMIGFRNGGSALVSLDRAGTPELSTKQGVTVSLKPDAELIIHIAPSATTTAGPIPSVPPAKN